MFKVTPGFSTSLPPATIDAWRGRLDRIFASQPSKCAVARGTYPVALPPLSTYVRPLAARGMGERVTGYVGSWVNKVIDYTGPLGTVTVKVDADDLEVQLRRHKRAADRSAPAMSVLFSAPVRVVMNLLPAFADTIGANWICGAYEVAIGRIVLDGNGRVTLHAETGLLLSLPLHRAEQLLKWSGYDPQKIGLDTGFFENVVDALMTLPAGAAAAPARAGARPVAALAGLKLSTHVDGLDRYRLNASGNLRQIAKEHPIGRAVLQNPLCQALLPPVRAAVENPRDRDVAYRLRTQADYDAGTLHVRAAATPATPRAPAWDAFVTVADANQPRSRRIVRGVAMALQPTPSSQVTASGYALRVPPARSAPLAALVHGFDTEALAQADAAPQLPAPPVAPLAPAPPLAPPLPGLPSALPKEIEEPLVRMLGHVRLSAQANLRAGTYSTDAWAPNSRLVAPVDGSFEFEAVTQPATANQEARLQRAALRWTGETPLVWHLGFSNFLLSAAVGRLLDRLFHVRIRGVEADADGRLRVDGDLYLLGLRICRVDTLAQWAARKWPEACAMMFAETNPAQWLQGIFLHPEVSVTNDECWHMWRNIRGMDMDLQWQLQPLGDATTLDIDAAGAGRFSTAPLAGEVRLTDAGDAHISIATAPQHTSCFDFGYQGALDVEGAWSARIIKRMFPYPEHTVVDAATVDETQVTGVLDVQVRAPKPAQIHAEVTWTAANPSAVRARVDAGVTLDGGHVTGHIAATGHAPTHAHAAFVVDRATWQLDHDLPMPGITLQAGAGGFFTDLSEPQRLHLMRLRADQHAELVA